MPSQFRLFPTNPLIDSLSNTMAPSSSSSTASTSVQVGQFTFTVLPSSRSLLSSRSYSANHIPGSNSYSCPFPTSRHTCNQPYQCLRRCHLIYKPISKWSCYRHSSPSPVCQKTVLLFRPSSSSGNNAICSLYLNGKTPHLTFCRRVQLYHPRLWPD
jgi:hypothetical protein